MCLSQLSKDKIQMVNHPLVTIGALSFNTGKFVAQAIESVLKTGYPNVEIICIDDASEDDSPEILMALSAKLGFKFVQNEVNRGLVANCNLALSLASGDYLLFVSDDLILGNRILHDVSILATMPDIAFVCSRALLIDEEARLINGDAQIGADLAEGIISQSAKSIWLAGSKVVTPTVTHRIGLLRDLGGFDAEFEIEDRPLYIKLARLGFQGWHRPEVTTLYRRHGLNFGSVFRRNMLKEDRRILAKFRIAILPILVALKQVAEVHYWMLFRGIGVEPASDALRRAGLSSFSWTTRSLIFKLTYYLRALIKGSRLNSNSVFAYIKGTVN